MKIRLIGLPQDVEKARNTLDECFEILSVSREYPENNSCVRVYYEVQNKNWNLLEENRTLRMQCNHYHSRLHNEQNEKIDVIMLLIDLIGTIEQECSNAKMNLEKRKPDHKQLDK
jgi:hypothetical protein